MKIVFTGGDGMLSFAFKEVIKDKNIDASFLDKDTLDITNSETIETYFHNNKFDVLINCAAYTKVDQAENELELANNINGTAVGYLAKKCKEKNILFVTYSTDYVFDGEQKDGYEENKKTDPLNAYGKSKEIGEKLTQEINSKYYLIRTQWLYGPNGKNFVRTISNAWKDGKSLSIINDQFGAPTYTIDLAKATLDLIENEDKYLYGIYHITNQGQCSWYEFAKYFLKIENKGQDVEIKPVTSEEYITAAKRPHYSKLINTKFNQLRDWKDAVYEYINNGLE